MTKSVRIENADTSDHKLVVEVWIRGHNVEPDRLMSTHRLNNPTDMVTTYVFSEQYLIVREAIDGE